MTKKIVWNKKTYQKYLNYLKSLGDVKYKSFSLKLIKTKYEMLGIRLPILRDIAKNISQTNIKSFFKYKENIYFEEVMIRGLVISSIKEKDLLLKYLPKYVPLIDNWSICDSVAHGLKIVKQDYNYWFSYFLKYLKSTEVYTIRFGLVIFLNFYIKEEYLDIIFAEINELRSDYYYVNMAISWFLCESFIKFPTKTLTFLQKNKLNSFTFNKTISKIRDSYRVSEEVKKYLQTLKRKD